VPPKPCPSKKPRACWHPGATAQPPARSPSDRLPPPLARFLPLQAGAVQPRFGAGYIAPHPSIRKDAVDVDNFLRDHQAGGRGVAPQPWGWGACNWLAALRSPLACCCCFACLLEAQQFSRPRCPAALAAAGLHRRVPGQRAAGASQPHKGRGGYRSCCAQPRAVCA
jgi:hypothetical protein